MNYLRLPLFTRLVCFVLFGINLTCNLHSESDFDANLLHEVVFSQRLSLQEYKPHVFNSARGN